MQTETSTESASDRPCIAGGTQGPGHAPTAEPAVASQAAAGAYRPVQGRARLQADIGGGSGSAPHAKGVQATVKFPLPHVLSGHILSRMSHRLLTGAHLPAAPAMQLRRTSCTPDRWTTSGWLRHRVACNMTRVGLSMALLSCCTGCAAGGESGKESRRGKSDPERGDSHEPEADSGASDTCAFRSS